MNCPYCGRDISAHFPLTDAQRRVLDVLDPWRLKTGPIIADEAGYSAGYTRYILRQLLTMDLIFRKGKRGGYVKPPEKRALQLVA